MARELALVRPLLDPGALIESPIVANCEMNRERRLAGSNGYGRELGFDVLTFLRERAQAAPVAWVDLCCGTGRALVEAAAQLARTDQRAQVTIEGVDLAGLFALNPFPDLLKLHVGTVEAWAPLKPYDLITCVHGLHYVGDKLAVLAKAAASLSPCGLLIANLDLAGFRQASGRPAARLIAARLRDNGFQYDTRRHLVRCEGPREAAFGLRYLGADDTVGLNYTGQPAVASYYAC